MIQENLDEIITKAKNYRDIFFNKDLAKLGDNYVNFIYSLARSIATKSVSGEKVAGKVLTQSIRYSELNKHIPSRTSTHEISDGVEALLVFIWLKKKMTIDDMVEILVAELVLGDFSNRKNEFDTAVLAFTKLLNEIEKIRLF